jgi:hypothetical protein
MTKVRRLFRWLLLPGLMLAQPVEAGTEAYLALGGGLLDPDSTGRAERRQLYVNLAFAGDGRFAPFGGLMRDDEGASALYVGAIGHWRLADRWTATASFAPALYHAGESKDLGQALQFRSEIGVLYRVHRGLQIGIAFHHFSNAGLSDRNPGTNFLGASIVVPLQGAP